MLERLSYDAWGKRRNADGSDDPSGSITSQTSRGFTEHEELDSVGLVHMNGRVYDPLLARFGTADPTTESPFSTQGWNRYSYVGNSPLNFTDPSGYCFMGCFWKSAFRAIGNFFRQNWGSLFQTAATALCAATPGCQPFLPIVAGFASAFVTGVTSGNLGQALRAGFISAITAAAFFQVGEFTSGLLPIDEITGARAAMTFGSPVHLLNVTGHAAVGCLSAVASRGKCGAGALSAAAGSFVAPLTQNAGFFGGLVNLLDGGGLASVAGGGKFANGAVTAAFGYLSNWCAHDGPCAPRSSNEAPGIPDALRRSLDRVENMVMRTGDEALIDRYDAMRIIYYPDRDGGTVYGAASFEDQTIKFTRSFARFTETELDFIVAHEFAHLTPENNAIPRGRHYGLLGITDTPSEQHADAFARRILRIYVNPGRFGSSGRR